MQRTVAISALAVSVFAMGADSGAMNDGERAFLVEQMETTKKAFLASIAGLSEAQWTFKPAPAVWSVAECAEHILLAEDYIFNASQGILKTPVVARLETSTLEHDRMLAAAILDRSHKATAPEPIDPVGKGPIMTPAEVARAFTEKRDQHIAYLKTTHDDLRLHTATTPNTGTMDCYQFILLTAAHSGRHTAQIKEVEANPNFPAK